MRHRLRLVALALLLAAGVAGVASEAGAEPTPFPTPAPPTVSPEPTRPATPPPDQTTPPQPEETPATSGKACQPKSKPEAERGVLGPFSQRDADGIPLSCYRITADTGGVTDFDRKLLLFMTEGLFALTKMIVGACCWLLGWVFKFGPADALLGPAREVAQTYHDHVITPLGLPGFLLTIAGFWCGLLIIRGRTSRGAAELAISLLISAVAATILANPAELLMGDKGLLGTTRDTSMALASITATGGKSDSQDPEQAAKPLNDALIDTLVVKPHQMLNWGVVFDDPDHRHKCLAAYKKTITLRPATKRIGPLDTHISTGDDVHSVMTKAGCKELADYNKEPTWDRMLGALLLLIAAALVALLVILMTGTLLIAICGLAFYAMSGGLVAVIAILPGGARGLLWRWVGGIAKVVLVILAVVMVIPLFALFIKALMHSASGEALVVRFLLLDVVAVAALVFHRKLIKFSTRAGQRIARRLEYARYGGARGMGSGYGGGYGGFGGGYGGLGMGQGWLGNGDPEAISPVTASGIYQGARAEIARVTGPAVRARQAWTGPAAANATAKRDLTQTASGLQNKLYGSRGGRALWHTGRGFTTGLKSTSKIAIASTVGLPVTAGQVPVLYGRGREAVTSHGRQLKARLAASRDRTRSYGQLWARNTGLSWAYRHVRQTGADLPERPVPAPKRPKRGPRPNAPMTTEQLRQQVRQRMADFRRNNPPPGG